MVVFVLWVGIAMTINAFHPAYVETYMPEFMSVIRKEASQIANGKKYGTISRAKKPSLEPTEFYTYSLAGAPKVKK